MDIKGLNSDEVKQSRKKYGNNLIEGKNKTTFLGLFIETLGDPIIKILLIALAIKTIFLFKDFDFFETIGIVIAIFVASLISVVSEYGSNKAFERMQEESSKINVRVIRNGNITSIPIDDIVKGDIIILSSGDRVPADAILIKGKLSVDESSINGETKEAKKESTSNINNYTNKNKVFRGTTIYDGEAYAKVVEVGMNTLYGKMAKELTEENDDSPLKIRLNSLAKTISTLGYIAAVLISISYLFSKVFILNNFDLNLIKNTITINKFLSYLLEALTLAVSVLVMSVPEGLPMMITLVLSTNSKKMLKDNVLVRKMVGIETSGNINILFTDKTGTLTKGKLEVIKIISANLKEYKNEKELSKDNKYYDIVKKSSIINNESSYSDNSVIGGNITDRAILSFFKNVNIKYKKDDIIPFNSKNKYSITRSNNLNYIKGAPEILINKIDTYYDIDGSIKRIYNIEKIKEIIYNNTKNGIRVLLMVTSNNKKIDNLDNLTLVGLILIKDEVRQDAIEGVKLVTDAHIKTVMITGDNKDTAISIGRECGIYKDGDLVLTSTELNKMSDDELKEKINKVSIVARSLPSDKSRLVRICQE